MVEVHPDGVPQEDDALLRQAFIHLWRERKQSAHFYVSFSLSLFLLLFKQSLPHTCSRVPLSSPLELWLTCSRYAGRTCLPGKHSVQTYRMWVTLTSEWFWCHGCQRQRLKTHPDAVGAAISAVPASSAFCFACRAFV